MADTTPRPFPTELSYISFAIGLTSFILTVFNLFALYADMAQTIRAAPQQIRDSLGSLREQILEERDALRAQCRELRKRQSQDRLLLSPSSHPAHAGRRRGKKRSKSSLKDDAADNDVNNEQVLRLHYQTVRDLWRRFKTLERPFLVRGGGGGGGGLRAEAVHLGAPWEEGDLVDEKGVRVPDMEIGGSSGNYYYSSTVYQCSFMHRFIWYQTKGDVKKLAAQMQAIAVRRIEREVGECRAMLREMRVGRMQPVGESWDVYESSEDEIGGRPGVGVNEATRRGTGPYNEYQYYTGPSRPVPPVVVEIPRARTRQRPAADYYDNNGRRY